MHGCQGYKKQLDSDELKPLATERLRASKYALFANLEDIYNFHSQCVNAAPFIQQII